MLTQLTGYEGIAEVLGKLRAVKYEGHRGELRIEGLTMEEANDALGRLAVGAFAVTTVEKGAVVIRLQETPGAAPAPAAEVPPSEPLSPVAPVPTPTPAPVPVPVCAPPAAPQAPQEAPPAEPVPAAPEPAALAAPEPPVEPPPAAPEEPAEVPPVEVPSAASSLLDTLEHALRHATLVKDVIQAFETAGVTDLAEIVERAKEAKASGLCPLLTRITNLDDRIARTFHTLRR